MPSINSTSSLWSEFEKVLPRVSFIFLSPIRDWGKYPETVTFFFVEYESVALNWFSFAVVVEKPAVVRPEERPMPYRYPWRPNFPEWREAEDHFLLKSDSIDILLTFSSKSVRSWRGAQSVNLVASLFVSRMKEEGVSSIFDARREVWIPLEARDAECTMEPQKILGFLELFCVLIMALKDSREYLGSMFTIIWRCTSFPIIAQKPWSMTTEVSSCLGLLFLSIHVTVWNEIPGLDMVPDSLISEGIPVTDAAMAV